MGEVPAEAGVGSHGMDKSQPVLFRSPGLGSGPKGDTDCIFLGLGDSLFAPGVNLGLHLFCTSTGQGLQGHLDQPDTTPLGFSFAGMYSTPQRLLGPQEVPYTPWAPLGGQTQRSATLSGHSSSPHWTV